jgi:hypothetical protein
MKKLLFVLFMTTASLFAHAAVTEVCGGNGGSVAVTASSGNFIVNSFSMKCSANTYVAYDQSSTAIGVGAASIKGKNIFAGNSGGGGVASKGACTGTCSSTNATDAATAALGSASS